MIDRDLPEVSVVRQCELLSISRSSVHYRPAEASERELELMSLIDKQCLRTPFYGSRKMTAWLRGQGHAVNTKRVQRLMRRMGIEAIYRRPRTTRPDSGHKGVSLPAQRPSDQRGEPGLGDRHRLCPDGAGIHVPGSHHGLAQPVRALVEVVQHPGSRLLRGCVGGGIEHGRARDIQHRPFVVSSPPRRSPRCC